MDGHAVSPLDLSRTLLVGGSLLVSCFLPGPPVIKQCMQIVTMVPSQGGRFQSVKKYKIQKYRTVRERSELDL